MIHSMNYPMLSVMTHPFPMFGVTVVEPREGFPEDTHTVINCGLFSIVLANNVEYLKNYIDYALYM